MEVIDMIEVSKVSSKGQITIPLEVRKALKVKDGTKICFITDEHGRFYIVNASSIAIKDIQDAFEGVADELGIDSEEEVTSYLKESK